MSSPPEGHAAASSGPVRAPQSLIGGILLMALAALGVYLTQDLDQGTLRSIGPAMLPRWLAVSVGLCGLALAVASFLKDGDRIEGSIWRGAAFVILGILAFALTIRPVAVGPVTTPGLGLLVAGPLAIVIGGFATPEARLRELVIMALALTAFCMVLFGDLLNLPIPAFPQALTQIFPAGWSQKAVLRATAGILVLAAALVFLVTRGRDSKAIDVADHSGRI